MHVEPNNNFKIRVGILDIFNFYFSVKWLLAHFTKVLTHNIL